MTVVALSSGIDLLLQSSVQISLCDNVLASKLSGRNSQSNRLRPHDGRKHFVTMAKKYGVDEYAIKYMVGHKISDITEKVYTQREFEWLKDEIEKIK